MIGTGKTNKVIASALDISERTVKAHLTSIYKKLNIPDRLHLAISISDLETS
jgi:DNA-binding NarL/FixJ family response regulator